MPSIFEDFVKPWCQRFDDDGLVNRLTGFPAVDIKVAGDGYTMSLATPGMKREDFNIDLGGNILYFSSEKEESTETKATAILVRSTAIAHSAAVFALLTTWSPTPLIPLRERRIKKYTDSKRRRQKAAASKRFAVKQGPRPTANPVKPP